MEYKKTLIFLILIISSYSVSAQCDATVTVTEPWPPFKMDFSETVYVFNASLVTNDTEIELDWTPYPPNTSFAITHEEPLRTGSYSLIIYSEDSVGNANTQHFCLNVEIPPLQIELTIPNKYGFTPVDPFNITILTKQTGADESAYCKWNWIGEIPFEQMNVFNEGEEPSVSHTLTQTLGEPDKLSILYVKCKTSDQAIHFQTFNFTYDPTPAVFSASVARGQGSPPTIIEPPTKTTLIINSDDEANCRFSTTAYNYSIMEEFFDTGQSGYSSQNNKDMPIEDNSTYVYNISCKNKAGLISPTQKFFFNVDFKVSFTIAVNSPPAQTRNTTITLDVTTNKVADCKFQINQETPTPFDNTGSFRHTHILAGTHSEGSHSFNIQCSTATKPLPTTVTVNTLIDLTPPTISKSDIKAHNTCVDGQLEIEWEANDNLSGVAEYKYMLREGSIIKVPETSTSSNSVSFEDMNLTLSRNYYFTVKAADGVGNWMTSAIESNPLKSSDPDGEQCKETIPPQTNISTRIVEGKFEVTIHCNDASGCRTDATFYGTADTTQACKTTMRYITPVTIEPNQVFCWKVEDVAGNIAARAEELTLADSDNDGIPDIADTCPDTATNATVDSSGCAQSQKDDDGDTVTNDKDDCPDTSELEKDYVDDAGCVPDTDNDGMPDYWEELYGLDPNDPSDKDEDLDADGATNWEEYIQNTDPTIPEGVEGLDDDDNDGVSNDIDKCQNTPSDEPVDEQGCSEDQLKTLDSDGDGMPDDWELTYGLDPNLDDAEEDPDEDGLTNLEEYQYDTDPFNFDTDGDKYSDGAEINEHGTDPLDPEDKPTSPIVPIAAGAGGLTALGGLGYWAFRKFLQKPAAPTPKAPPVTLAKPIAGIKGAAPEVTAVKPKLKKPSMEEIRRKETRRLQLEKHAAQKTKKHGELFESFTGKSKKEGIHKIELPKKIKKPVIKRKAVETPKPKVKPKPAVSKPNVFDKISSLKKPTEFDKLDKISKSDVKQLLQHKDKDKAIKIFDKLHKANLAKPEKDRTEAFGKLSNLLKGKTDLSHKDILKDMPSTLKSSSDHEAKIFAQLSNAITTKETPEETLKKLARKK